MARFARSTTPFAAMLSAAMLVVACGGGARSSTQPAARPAASAGAGGQTPSAARAGETSSGPAQQQGIVQRGAVQQDTAPQSAARRGTAQQGTAQQGAPQQGAGMSAADCPMTVPGTRVERADLDGGSALTFTTDSVDRVEELRLRVRRMATTMESRHGELPPAGMRGPMVAARMMPPARAEVVDVANGARLELRAVDPDDVETLRAHLREHGEIMRTGACPMMQHGTAAD